MVSRDLRLRTDFEVRQARSRGKAHADGPLVFRVLRNRTDGNHYAFVAGKRVGNSVHRNRSKRLCREVIRHLHPRIQPGHDIVIIVRGVSTDLPSYDVTRAIIERILTRARLLMPEPLPPEPQPGDGDVGAAPVAPAQPASLPAGENSGQPAPENGAAEE